MPAPSNKIAPAEPALEAPSSFTLLADAAPRSAALGLYVHVPFCAKRCYYCAFNTAPLGDAAATARFVGTVCRELALVSTLPWARDIAIATVFFGGGTPSTLGAPELAAVLDSVRARFTVAPSPEITVECNPESVERRKLEGYRRAGVNRISLGVQTLDDAVLPTLGRTHTARDAEAAFTACREAGFDNVSVDVMYGLPDLPTTAFERGLGVILGWEPEHLSSYGLSLDAGSLWGATGVDGLPSEEGVVAQYWTLARRAAEHGLEHYEISNYARPGRRSRHNLNYWRRGEYLAVGPGAAGFVGDVRYTNVKPVARYEALTGEGWLPVGDHETLSPRQALGERLILGLRTADGVPTAWLEERLHGEATLGRRLDDWRIRGLLSEARGRTRLSEEGFLLSDALFVELL